MDFSLMDIDHDTLELPVVSSTNLSANNSLTLPPEIWLLIFLHLFPKEIQNVTLTCQSFRHMAQSLLFRCLTFRPFDVKEVRLHNLDSRLYRSEPRDIESMKRFMRRLKYCTSSQITPGTRRLEIYPIYGHAETPTSDGDGLLLHATLRRVPFFVNLSTVICSHLTLDSTLWNDFCGVHKLRKLKLQDCVLELGLTGPPPTFLDVGSVEILSRDLIAFPVENWVPCFHSDRIEVTIDDPRCGEFSLQRLCQSPHTMRHLRCLTTGVHQGQLPLLELLLAHSPPLRHLVLHTSDNIVLGRQTCTYIPPLDTYHGPYEFLRTLLSGESLRNMRQISITSYFTLEDPSHTLRILRELGTSTGRLEALRIPTRFLAKQVLATISFLFVHLRHLSVIHLNPNPNPPDPPDACTFLELLLDNLILPSKIETLSITWDGYLSPPIKTEDCDRLRDRLIRIYPNLRILVFAGRGRYIWKRNFDNHDAGIHPFLI